MLRAKKRGQTTLEYTLVIIVVVGALIATGVYFKRGLQGKWKESVDQLGDQYDPLAANSRVLHSITTNTVTSLIVTENTNMAWTTRSDLTNSAETKTGTMRIGSYW